ncbi:MAG: FAD-binding protein [Microbacteriaceae bacterium]|nr:FAD-binding protein [Microbacteriaceae bacterium]
MTVSNAARGVGTNWAGTYTFTAKRLHYPRTLDEVREIVSRSPRVRALGTRHSFNDGADNDGDLVSLADLELDPVIDPAASTVTVAAGIRYGVLASYLQQNGYALHNMGSLPHISVAGAVSTGTHGSGDTSGNLSTAVSGLEIVSGRGAVISVTRDDRDFEGMVVGLGALGIVTRVTLDLQPSFDMRQDLYDDLPWDTLLGDVAAVTSSAYSVSLFTNWLGESLERVWMKTKLERGEPSTMPEVLFGAHRSSIEREADYDNITVRGGVPGPWSERLPHFRLDATPSHGDEIQTEYFIDRSNAVDALGALRAMGEQIAPHLRVAELRTVASDSLWMSPAYGRDTLGIAFTWKNEPDAVARLATLIEAALAAYDPRPHWGKLFAMDAAAVAPKYERLADFGALADRLDPDRQFRNEYLERVLGI